MMLLIQILFFAEYRKLPFTTNFWAFTFPIAASANLAVRWLNAGGFPLWRAWSWCLAGIATAFVITLATATVDHWLPKQASRTPGADHVRARHEVNPDPAAAIGTGPNRLLAICARSWSQRTRKGATATEPPLP